MNERQERIRQEIEEKGRQNPALAGEIVSFKTGGCGVVSLVNLREVLEDVGVDSSQARDLMLGNAFRRALRAMKSDRAIDKLEEDGGKIRFQLTEKRESPDQVVYNYEAMLSLDTESGEITCLEEPELVGQARELFQVAIGTRTSRDLKALIKRLFEQATDRDLYCINRESGGSYFVPEQHKEFTAKMDVLLRELGGRLERFPVPRGTEEGDASVRSAVAEGIERWVEGLDAVVAGWDVDSRTSTHDRYAEHYRKAVLKAEAWSEYLGDEVQRLRERVEVSKTQMAAKILRLAAEKEQRTTPDVAEIQNGDVVLTEDATEDAAAV